MSVLEQLCSNLKRIQDDEIKKIIMKRLHDLDDEKLVNHDAYTSVRKPGKPYTNDAAASLSRLIESRKGMSNEKLTAILHFSKDRINDIRTGKVHLRKDELAQIVIALDLGERTVRKLFLYFSYSYDTETDPVDFALNVVINAYHLRTVDERLNVFRILTAKS